MVTTAWLVASGFGTGLLGCLSALTGDAIKIVIRLRFIAQSTSARKEWPATRLSPLPPGAERHPRCSVA